MRGTRASVRCVYLTERMESPPGIRCAEETREVRRARNGTPVASEGLHDSNHVSPVSVVGSHGGAATSTIAHLLNAVDAGTRWPRPDEPSLPLHVVLTARTSAAGLMAASQELAGYCATQHPDGPYLVGCVLTADAPGRIPKPLSRRIIVLSSAMPVFQTRWVSQWRLSEIPDPRAEWPVVMSLRSFVERAVLAATATAR
jgi:hypothetical protein